MDWHCVFVNVVRGNTYEIEGRKIAKYAKIGFATCGRAARHSIGNLVCFRVENCVLFGHGKRGGKVEAKKFVGICRIGYGYRMCVAIGGVSECDGCIVGERKIGCASGTKLPVH